MNIYKYYNSKKQRLAIGVQRKEDTLELTIIKCSTKDQFNKKLANQVLKLLKVSNTVRLYGQLFHPEKITIPIGDNWRKDLFDFLNKNYYKIDYYYMTYKIMQLKRDFDVIFYKKINENRRKRIQRIYRQK